MKTRRTSMILAALMLAAVVQHASAQGLAGVPAPGLANAPGQAKKLPILLGATVRATTWTRAARALNRAHSCSSIQ
jgi:hypothetical protein